MKISEIVIGERNRRDLGDIRGLADSIEAATGMSHDTLRKAKAVADGAGEHGQGGLTMTAEEAERALGLRRERVGFDVWFTDDHGARYEVGSTVTTPDGREWLVRATRLLPTIGDTHVLDGIPFYATGRMYAEDIELIQMPTAEELKPFLSANLRALGLLDTILAEVQR